MKSDNSISVFIAEDIKPARDLLTNYIQQRPELEITGIAKNGMETVKKLSQKNYDLLFLDINFPDISGIEVLERLNKHPHIIFTTSYDKYAIKAFEVGAIDYLLKPFSKKRFNQSVDKALLKISNNENNNCNPQKFAFSFKEKGSNYVVAFDDIMFFSSKKKHTIIHTEEKCFETFNLLKNIESQLPPESFSRIHKQYIVNLKYLSRIDYMTGGQFLAYIKFDGETTLPIGRTYAPSLKEKLGILKKNN